VSCVDAGIESQVQNLNVNVNLSSFLGCIRCMMQTIVTDVCSLSVRQSVCHECTVRPRTAKQT